LIGKYKIAIWYGKLPGNTVSKHVKFTVQTRTSAKDIDVDQTKEQGQWNDLGIFENPILVKLEASSDGPVVADAVRFTRTN